MAATSSSPPPPAPLIAGESPVHGLTRRQLPGIPVFAQSVAAIAPAGTSGVTPVFVIVAVGGTTTLASFLVATVAVMLVAACIRPMAQRLAVVGGLYSYVAQGIGPRVALPTAWSAVVGYTAVSMAGLIAVGLYLNHIVVSIGLVSQVSAGLICVIVVVAALLMTVLMVRGVKVSAAATLFVEVFAVVIMVGLTLWVGYSHRDQQWSQVFPPAVDTGSLPLQVVVAVSAFVGFESATTLSAEARRPFLVVPRTLRWTPVMAAVIYLLAAITQSVAMFDAPRSVLTSSTPLASLFLASGDRVAATVLDIGIATSFFACSLASVNALVRVLFTLGREHVIPVRFGLAHQRFHTPAAATVMAMLVVVAGPLVFLWCAGDPESGIRDFLTLSALGYMGSYLTACLSTPLLLRRIGEPSRALTVLGVATAAILFALLVVGALATDFQDARVLFAFYAASVLVVTAVVLAVSIRAPRRLARVGVFDETSQADVLTTATIR